MRFNNLEDDQEERAEAHFSARNLLHNYNVIQSLADGRGMIPMIKADAYGHGMAWAGRLLAGQPGLYALGVATLQEGIELRKSLGLRHRKVPIHVFSGSMPFTESVGQACEANRLVPVIASDEDWNRFLKEGWSERIPYEIKFNTGMNRLGLSLETATKIARDLRNKTPPQGILSHFAMSDQKDAKLTQLQVERFRELRRVFTFPATHFHMANSGAIWNIKNLAIDCDVVRPGISLYGVPPWAEAPVRDLRPVLTSLRAKILLTRSVKQGETIGYNAAYKVSEKAFRMAVLGMGYGDGWHRTLTNKGIAEVSGRREPILGVVSMDLTAVRCGARTKAGDWAELLGNSISAWEIALAASTIPYEVFTSLTPRVRRIYRDE